MRITPYAQSTCESCLAVCLLQLSKQPITRQRELEVLFFALTFSKSSFALGHLEWFARKIGTTCRVFWGDGVYPEENETRQLHPRIQNLSVKVDARLLDSLITRNPVAVYIDSYAFWKTVHYPHFVILLSRTRKGYRVFDPWDGKTREVTTETLRCGLDGLRNRLKFRPLAIQLEA